MQSFISLKLYEQIGSIKYDGSETISGLCSQALKLKRNRDLLSIQFPFSHRIFTLTADVPASPAPRSPLAALLAFAGGTSVLSGAGRLREKESDRLASACDLVLRAGGVARQETVGGDVRLSIHGAAGTPRAAAFAAHGDHRVAMSAAVLALATPPGSTLDDPGAASKSWPEFFDLWAGLVSPRG